jgi:hypothetical protein
MNNAKIDKNNRKLLKKWLSTHLEVSCMFCYRILGDGLGLKSRLTGLSSKSSPRKLIGVRK